VYLGFVKNIFSGSKGAGFNAVGADPQQLHTAYNQTQDEIAKQNQFVQALQAVNGIGNQAQVFQQQQNLSNQLQNVADGTGPNPAQNMLNQATGQNIANQTALMAGQRGASQNAGLIARQAAQQGAATEQQAVGQAATMQAQQQINALGQLGQQQANMANLATNQVGQLQTAQQQATNASLQQQSNLMGLQSSANSSNAAIQGEVAKGQMNLFGNVTGGIGSALGLAKGGEVHTGPQSNAVMHMLGMAEGGAVPAVLSPGEKVVTPEQVAKGANPIKDGKTVPGKAKVKGAVNSYANDVVPAKLEEGSIVIPRSITQAKDADKKAAEFVAAILAKKGKALPKRS
jgi:hypothetical protein